MTTPDFALRAITSGERSAGCWEFLGEAACELHPAVEGDRSSHPIGAHRFQQADGASYGSCVSDLTISMALDEGAVGDHLLDL